MTLRWGLPPFMWTGAMRAVMANGTALATTPARHQQRAEAEHEQGRAQRRWFA